MLQNISSDCKFVKVQDPTTAGTSDVTSDAVDLGQDGGYEGVIFVSSYGTAAAGNKPYVQVSTDNGVLDAFADLAGSQVAPGASDEDAYCDVCKPQYRYVRAVFQRGTSSTLGDIWAILYNPRLRPVSNVLAGTINGKATVAALKGTK